MENSGKFNWETDNPMLAFFDNLTKSGIFFDALESFSTIGGQMALRKNFHSCKITITRTVGRLTAGTSVFQCFSNQVDSTRVG